MPVALPGIGVARDIVIGRARILRRDRVEIVQYVLREEQVEAEIARFAHALSQARAELLGTRERIPADTPGDIAAFIDTHLLMLEDATLTSAPAEIIRRQRCNAEWALQQQQDALDQAFLAMDDPYLKTRRDDVEHVIRSVQRILLSGSRHNELYEPVDGFQVVVTDELSPSDLLVLHHQGVAGIVTERGGPLSHTAILARSLAMPAVMGVHRAHHLLKDDETIVVDGTRGMVLAGLGADGLAFYRGLQSEQQRRRAGLRRLKDLPARTRDGIDIAIQANIELPADLASARQLNMDGVGLFRTEFLYMNRAAPPDEEEQFRVFRSVVQKLKGAPLTIRTIDLGLDKGTGVGPAGDSSALGLRGLRLCLKELDLFRPQLRAILRASANGPVRLLLPMVTNLTEIEQVHHQLAECRRNLAADGYDFDPAMPVGAVIEVPAAALCADMLADHLDFFSIGTNDLIQYTLATDRIDENVNHLYQPLHPAVLQLIAHTLDAGRRTGTPVAMCGEMAGDPAYTRLLLGLGLREFSMPPSAALEVKQVINGSDTRQLRQGARALLTCRHPSEAAAVLERLNQPYN